MKKQMKKQIEEILDDFESEYKYMIRGLNYRKRVTKEETLKRIMKAHWTNLAYRMAFLIAAALYLYFLLSPR